MFSPSYKELLILLSDRIVRCRSQVYKVSETLSCNVKQIGKGARAILCKKQLNVRFEGCNVFTFLTLHCAVRLWKLGKGVYLSQDCGKGCMEQGALFVHGEDILWVSHVIMNVLFIYSHVCCNVFIQRYCIVRIVTTSDARFEAVNVPTMNICSDILDRAAW
jgi:hypothetical protein